mgnify:CR=1 FL=1|jgi:hypothetical protein
MAEKLKVITPDNLGKGIAFNPKTKKWEVNVETGLTCASIDQLPTKPWKKGTTLLAKQDGECIKLTALDSIFQEIGVGIAADKTSAFTGEEYRVVVTVSNTGEGKNDLTNLVVQKPLLGNYNIKDVTTSHQGLDSFDRKNDLAYDLKGLAKGGTFILRFTVVANDIGTFQFSASVNPNSALDQEQKNNTATITLSANSKIDTTYVPSVDCPRITATELDSNTQLVMMDTRYPHDPEFVNGVNDKANVFANRENLKGLRIRLDGASTVVVYASYSNGTTNVIKLSNGKFASTRRGRMGVSANANSPLKSDSTSMPFVNGILTIDKDCDGAFILCRPQGKNCRWQAFAIRSAPAAIESKLAVVSNQGFKMRYEESYDKSSTRLDGTFPLNIIPNTVKYEVIPYTSTYHNLRIYGGSPLSVNRKLILTVKRGNAAILSFNPENVSQNFIPRASGKTTVTGNIISVTADATSTDSINSEYLQVIVED